VVDTELTRREAKATDENLTSENWEYIMDVCDKVTGEDNGPKDAVASMIKRLAHRNANVQLYTLEVRIHRSAMGLY
jgi:signal transducing adaptor molecule